MPDLDGLFCHRPQACLLYTSSDTALGAIPAQIDYALNRLPPARQLKLYNSGSFFDRKAIPLEDHASIADRVTNFERSIVECHPALVGDDCWRFRDRLSGTLEVAMGLETVHPETLSRLNKRMSVDQFATAADLLLKHDVDLRVFILVKPPFMREEKALEWAARSLEFAFDCGATAATLIPVSYTHLETGVLNKKIEFSQYTDTRFSDKATLQTAWRYEPGIATAK